MKQARFAIGITAMVMAGGLVAGATAAVLGFRIPALHGATAGRTAAGDIAPAWTETRWPFLLDQWGVGRAFVCGPADCGARIEMFIRPKLGFCNCTTGVSDDIELERVADTDLVSTAVQPLGPGAPVNAGWMRGRSRLYQVSAARLHDRLLSVAVNDRCDVVVAVAALGNADPIAVNPAVIALLNSPPVLKWAKKELGL
jgi:hypothetical protein